MVVQIKECLFMLFQQAMQFNTKLDLKKNIQPKWKCKQFISHLFGATTLMERC